MQPSISTSRREHHSLNTDSLRLQTYLQAASRALAFSRVTEIPPISVLTVSALAVMLLGASPVLAQETTETVTTETTTVVAPETGSNASTQESATEDGEQPAVEIPFDDIPIDMNPPELPPVAPLPQPKAGGTQLFADSVRVENGVVIAESKIGKGVRLESPTIKVFADRVTFDAQKRILKASGKVRVERPRAVERIDVAGGPKPKARTETITETLRGENFEYDFNSQQGRLDNVGLQLADFSVKAESLVINGKQYTATNVVLRPGGLTPEEEKIYGTPPFNVRARIATYDASGPRASTAISRGATGGNPGQSSTTAPDEPRVVVKNAALYYKNTKILPIPGFVFSRLGGDPREPQAYTLTPRISLNRTDGILVTTQLRYPFSLSPDSAVLNADLGISTKIGFRGGLSLEKPTRIGTFAIGFRENDIVTSQLESRIVLDRQPEISYVSPLVPVFELPGNRLAGMRLELDYGRYNERTIGSGAGEIEASRTQGILKFTTRARDKEGLYLELAGRLARYSNRPATYRSTTFEVGYQGQLLPRVRGIFSYRQSNIKGETPFRFDRVEIRRELRSTFDFELTKRYIIPLDLRYDLDERDFRDVKFGLLRNYKIFAYGLVYSTAREELRFELRRGF